MKLDTRVWTQTEREGGLSLGFPCIIQWHGPVRFALRTSATNEKQTVGARSPHRGWLGWLGARRVWESEERIESERNSAMIVGWGKWTARSWINHLSVAVEGLAARDKSSALIPQRQPADSHPKWPVGSFCIIAVFLLHTRRRTHRLFCADKMELDSVLRPPWPDLRLRVGLHSHCRSHAAAWTRGQGRINFFLSQTDLSSSFFNSVQDSSYPARWITLWPSSLPPCKHRRRLQSPSSPQAGRTPGESLPANVAKPTPFFPSLFPCSPNYTIFFLLQCLFLHCWKCAYVCVFFKLGGMRKPNIWYHSQQWVII